MPATLLVDGSALNVQNVDYVTVRRILFEKNFTGLPAGVTRQSGATVNWVEFAPPATEGQTFSVNPNNVSQIFPY